VRREHRWSLLGAGRLASVDGPLGNETIAYAYDALGRITNRAINGVAQTVAFDALGRVTVVANVLGSFTNFSVGATSRVATNRGAIAVRAIAVGP
jgi:YD repeat-containing protein